MTNINDPLLVHKFKVPYCDLSKEKLRWKKVPGFPKLKASTWGAIKNLETGKLLIGSKTRKGYVQVRYNGKTYRVHRLIALTFCHNPNNLPQVNHKDGLKHFNFASNLEWCTGSHNQRHAINFLGYENNFGAKPVQILKDNIIVFTGRTVREASRFLGCQATQVSKVCTGRRNHIHGYVCQYIEEN